MWKNSFFLFSLSLIQVNNSTAYSVPQNTPLQVHENLISPVTLETFMLSDKRRKETKNKGRRKERGKHWEISKERKGNVGKSH